MFMELLEEFLALKQRLDWLDENDVEIAEKRMDKIRYDLNTMIDMKIERYKNLLTNDLQKRQAAQEQQMIRPTGSTALAMRIAQLEAKNTALRNGYAEILDLSAGWDEHGSTGLWGELSWESVGRLAMDISRAAMGSNDQS